MAVIAAMVCFLFACFKFEPFNGKPAMIPLGLFFLALAFLIGNWPVGAIGRRQP
jgi:hypothetical protein